MSSDTVRWWGQHDLADGEIRRFEIGALTLDVGRERGEWRLAWSIDRDPLLRRCSITQPERLLDPGTSGDSRRIYVDGDHSIHLQPLMADRAIVVRPESCLLVPPADRITVLVACPLWVSVQIGSDIHVADLSTCRPSDTWFGPNSMHGELCYAGRTWAKTRESELGDWPNRSIVEVEIENQAPDMMEISQIRVPAPNLPLYAAADGRLWTPGIRMRREANGQTGRIQILPGSPREELVSIGDERQVVSGRSIRRGLHRLFK